MTTNDVCEGELHPTLPLWAWHTALRREEAPGPSSGCWAVVSAQPVGPAHWVAWEMAEQSSVVIGSTADNDLGQQAEIIAACQHDPRPKDLDDASRCISRLTTGVPTFLETADDAAERSAAPQAKPKPKPVQCKPAARRPSSSSSSTDSEERRRRQRKRKAHKEPKEPKAEPKAEVPQGGREKASSTSKLWQEAAAPPTESPAKKKGSKVGLPPPPASGKNKFSLLPQEPKAKKPKPEATPGEAKGPAVASDSLADLGAALQRARSGSDLQPGAPPEPRDPFVPE